MPDKFILLLSHPELGGKATLLLVYTELLGLPRLLALDVNFLIFNG
ncbi:MAG: hypothetical protein WC924_06235 [Candidatus Gracilibacteria bacterium]